MDYTGIIRNEAGKYIGCEKAAGLYYFTVEGAVGTITIECEPVSLMQYYFVTPKIPEGVVFSGQHKKNGRENEMKKGNSYGAA